MFVEAISAFKWSLRLEPAHQWSNRLASFPVVKETLPTKLFPVYWVLVIKFVYLITLLATEYLVEL
jgi:hypothetical protein